MKIMSESDIKKADKAIQTLDRLNAKYEKPYGENILGIIINTYQNVKLKELQPSDNPCCLRRGRKKSSTFQK